MSNLDVNSFLSYFELKTGVFIWKFRLDLHVTLTLRSRLSLGEPLRTSHLWFAAFFVEIVIFKIFKVDIDLEVKVLFGRKIYPSFQFQVGKGGFHLKIPTWQSHDLVLKLKVTIMRPYPTTFVWNSFRYPACFSRYWPGEIKMDQPVENNFYIRHWFITD